VIGFRLVPLPMFRGTLFGRCLKSFARPNITKKQKRIPITKLKELRPLPKIHTLIEGGNTGGKHRRRLLKVERAKKPSSPLGPVRRKWLVE
jgi:hypothetical protein